MNEMKAERVNHANTSDDIIRYDDIKVGDLVTFKTTVSEMPLHIKAL